MGFTLGEIELSKSAPPFCPLSTHTFPWRLRPLKYPFISLISLLTVAVLHSTPDRVRRDACRGSAALHIMLAITAYS